MDSEITQPRLINKKPQVKSTRLTAIDYVIFFIPCVQFIRINIVGVMTGTDIPIIIAFLYLGLRGKLSIKSARARRVLVLAALWLLSQCITDIVRHSPFSNYSRGWSNIGLTLISYVVLCTMLYGKPRRMMIFGWGVVASGVLKFFVNPDTTQLDYPWKFGLSFSVTLAVALWASRKECRGNTPALLMAMIGALNLILAFRSAGGICLAAALYLGLMPIARRKNAEGATLSKGLIIAVAVLFVVGIAGVFWFYQYAAINGYLGEEAQKKYEQEASGKYGVLLGGRVEMLADIPAIVDSPILGHGSWAQDPAYLLLMRQAMALLDYKGALEMTSEELTSGLIPQHSFLLGAWVYAGILGAVFWGWIWVLIVRTVARIYPAAAYMLPAVVYLGFVLLWDILFSPFGLERRVLVPYYVVLIITYYDWAERSAALSAPAPLKGSLRTALSPGH